MEPKIKLIVNHTYSKGDIYGNVYWFCKVTSTKTGKSVVFTTPHESNTKGLIREMGFEWEDMYSTEKQLPIRRFNSFYNTIVLHNSCMDSDIKDAIFETTVDGNSVRSEL